MEGFLPLPPKVRKGSASRLQLLQRKVVQIAMGFLLFQRLPVPILNWGTETEYSLLGKLDCCQEENKCGVLPHFFYTN